MNLDDLNEMQKEAALTTEGAVLMLAGAGSGKTRALAYRIAQMVEKGISPWEILAITFTNKAAREMRERVNGLVGMKAEHMLISTFHSACVRFLRRDIEKLGQTYTRNFTVYDGDDQKSVMKECFKTLNIDDVRFKQGTVLAQISRLKDELVSWKDYGKIAEGDFYAETVSRIYSLYQQRLKRNNALDFDDIIFLTVSLFKTDSTLLEKYQERFRYISVDEYQDTNTAQYVLIKLLGAKYKNVCVVGDDDQSIYGWRGAKIQNIYNFENDFPKTKVIKLEQNYRSTKNILSAANHVIVNNFGRKQKSLWTQNDIGSRIRCFAGENEHEEARFIAEIIKKQARAYNDYGLLYRINAQSRALEEALIKKDIPYRIYGGIRFYERKEIKDILAYLRIIVNPDDDISARRVINVPKRGAGKVFVDKVSDVAEKNDISFIAAVRKMESDNTKIPSAVIDFLNTIEELTALSSESKITSLLEELLTKTAYLKMLESEGDEYETDSRTDNVMQLISKAAEYEREAQDSDYDEGELTGLPGFLSNVALVADIDAKTDDESVVSLMTIHTAKGLEFPVVFLTGLEDGLFPGYGSITVPERLEEERRLFYVGVTRAREELFFTRAKCRTLYRDTDFHPPSRFLREVPPEFIETYNPSPSKIPAPPAPSAAQKPLLTRDAFVKAMNTLSTNVKIDYAAGDTVEHKKFGAGKVISITPAGKDYEVAVEFTNGSVKRFMAMLSGLKKI